MINSKIVPYGMSQADVLEGDQKYILFDPVHITRAKHLEAHLKDFIGFN